MDQNDSRTFLKNAIKQTLENGLCPPQMAERAGDPRSLTMLEKSAWLQLHNWSADEGLRQQNEGVAEFSRRRLAALLASLEE